MSRLPSFANEQRDPILAVRVTPRAGRDEIAGTMPDGTLKIRLTAPPVEGKANQALIEFLSAILEVPRSRLEIVSGMSNRNKLVAVHGLDEKSLRERLARSMRPV